MKSKKTKPAQEPVGIVISGFSGVPQQTVFAAYVWGPAPTTAEDSDAKTG